MNNTTPTPQGTKYHMSTRTNKPEKCNATVRRCRYGGDDAHFYTQERTPETLTKLIDATLAVPTPVVVTKPVFAAGINPSFTTATSLDMTWDTEAARAAMDVIGYRYADYACSNEDCSGFYCHDRVYTGAEAEPFLNEHIRPFLAAFFNVEEDQIPYELVDYAKYDLDITDALEYEVYTEWQLYGERVYARINPEVHNALIQWYLDQEGAEDYDKVLPYVRSKGVETTGLTPINALKKQLLKEHPNLNQNPHLVNAQNVNKIEVPLRNLVIDDRDTYDGFNISEKKAEETLTAYQQEHGNEFIAGVIVKDSANRYRLLDGNKRVKMLRRNKVKEEIFLCLS